MFMHRPWRALRAALAGLIIAGPSAFGAGPDQPAISQLAGNPVATRAAVTVSRTPLESRRPSYSDDSTGGYAIGDLWRGPGVQIWQAARVTPGAAVWTPLNQNPAAMPLPCDAATAAPVACYGMRRLKSAYTGSIITIQRLSDSSTLAIGYLPNNDLDTATMWAFCSNTICRIRQMFDQSGGAFHATQTTFAQMPIVSPYLMIGNTPAAVPEYAITTGATTASGFNTAATTSNLVIPTGVAATTHALAVVSLSQQRAGANGSNGSQIWTVGQLSGLAYQFAAQGTLLGGFDLGYATGSFGAYPQIAIVSVASNGIASSQLDNYIGPTPFLGASANALTGGFIGGSPTVSTTSPATVPENGQDMGEVIIWAANLSATDTAAVAGATAAAFQTVPQARNTVVVQGDSIMRGYIQPWQIGVVGRIAMQVPSNTRVYNKGRDGQTLAQMLTQYSIDVTDVYNPAAPLNVYVLWDSGNGINGGATDVQEEAAITSLIANAKTTGYTHIVVVTGTNRSNWTPASEAHEVYRLSVNAWIRVNANVLGYTVADVGADPLVGCTGCGANTTYFVDGTHPTPLGGEVITEIMDAAILPLLQ